MIKLPVALQNREDLDAILVAAFNTQASDVHLGGQEAIVVRQHGTLVPLNERLLTTADIQHLLIASYDENPAAITEINRGRDLDYAYTCRNPVNGHYLRWRVNAGSRKRFGNRDIKLVFRHINTIPPTVQQLHVEPEILTAVTNAKQGLVIITGATGNGKSTLNAALIRHRAECHAEHVVTLEAPIEYVYDELDTRSIFTAREISPVGGDSQSFSHGIVEALRKDPDVIVVGEARDKDTIAAAIHGAQTGHVLFTTVHTNGVAQTLSRLLQAFSSRDRAVMQMDLVDNLLAVIHQRLVPATDGTRHALREYLVFDEAVKDRLRKSTPDAMTLTCARALRRFGKPLVQDATDKYTQGLITEHTLQRMALEYQFSGDDKEVIP